MKIHSVTSQPSATEAALGAQAMSGSPRHTKAAEMVGSGTEGTVYSTDMCSTPGGEARANVVTKFVSRGASAFDELAGAVTMQCMDVSGEFHARLKQTCMGEPAPSKHAKTSHGTGMNFVFENAGKELPKCSHDEVNLVELARFIFDALGKLHACGFVHGDIKTNNICLGKDGKFRLIDFSSVRLGEYWEKTYKQVFIKTPCAYFPPELHTDKEEWANLCLSSDFLKGTIFYAKLSNRSVHKTKNKKPGEFSNFKVRCGQRPDNNPFQSEIFMAFIMLDMMRTSTRNKSLDEMIHTYYESDDWNSGPYYTPPPSFTRNHEHIPNIISMVRDEVDLVLKELAEKFMACAGDGKSITDPMVAVGEFLDGFLQQSAAYDAEMRLVQFSTLLDEPSNKFFSTIQDFIWPRTSIFRSLGGQNKRFRSRRRRGSRYR